MTQTEQIVWHKYPDEKPNEDNDYIVQMTNGRFEQKYYHAKSDAWSWAYDGVVIVWAELPKGWQDDTD